MATQRKPKLVFPESGAAGQPEIISAADRAVGAAFIASGVGSLVLGLGTIGAEASSRIKAFLTWIPSVGQLSGKVGLMTISFLVSWVILHVVFQDRPVKLMTSFATTMVLLVLGLMMTFPPIFNWLVGE